jgi:uncharacterized protein YutE (UPF0331/DUF86 family)
LKHKLSYLTFSVLLLILLAYVLLPLIRMIDPSLAQAQLNLDSSAVGLAAILVFVSFALVLIEKMPPSGYLSRLRLSAQGVEAEFQQLRQMARQVREEEVNPEIKEEIELIRESDSDPKGAFLELIIEIEKKLRFLASKRAGEDSYKYRSVRQIIDMLSSKGTIDTNLANLIREFWYLRNKAIHGEIEITKGRLDEAIRIGEVILSRLEKAYSG